MAIDEPLDKIKAITSENEKDPLGWSLILAGVVGPLFAIAGIFKGMLDTQQRWERVRAAFGALCDELERVRDRWPKDLERTFDQDWFKRAMGVLVSEANRAHSEERARLLARVAARGCFPTEKESHRQEDLASYIHDIARLGTDDIRFLRLLRDVNAEAIRRAPNLNLPEVFSNNLEEFKRKAYESGFEEDDRVSIAARLGGFGLAYENPRVTTRQSPGEHCFRPTKRGLYLLSLLDAAEMPIEKQN
jgi:hypothetical protein